MIKVIALMGKAGSGKDTLLHKLMEEDPLRFNEIISYTTRPPRDCEKDGADYHFVSDEVFMKMVNNGDMLEQSSFNGWHYGTAKVGLSETKINVGVFNPTGIRSLKNNRDIDLKVYYLRAEDAKRLERQLCRENKNVNVKEIVRRYSADEEDFRDLSDIDYMPLINNNLMDLAFITGYVIGQNSKII